MKNFIASAFILAAVGIAGAAWIGAADDERPVLTVAKVATDETCCQGKLTQASEREGAEESTQPLCCSTRETAPAVLAKPDAAGELVANGTKSQPSCDGCKPARETACGCASCSTESTSSENKVAECSHTGCDESTSVCCSAAAAQATLPIAAEMPNAAKRTAKDSCQSCQGACESECDSCRLERSNMTKRTESTTAAATASTAAGANAPAPAGIGHRHAGDSQHAEDHRVFFYLIEHRESIHRTVTNLPNGVETVTESDDPNVASMIQTHVEAMYDRMENENPIRMRDPIFRAIFANATKINLEIEHTESGVRVIETSDDAYAAKLVQEHAKVVSLWIKNGYSELPKNHPAPKP